MPPAQQPQPKASDPLAFLDASQLLPWADVYSTHLDAMWYRALKQRPRTGGYYAFPLVRVAQVRADPAAALRTTHQRRAPGDPHEWCVLQRPVVVALSLRPRGGVNTVELWAQRDVVLGDGAFYRLRPGDEVGDRDGAVVANVVLCQRLPEPQMIQLILHEMAHAWFELFWLPYLRLWQARGAAQQRALFGEFAMAVEEAVCHVAPEVAYRALPLPAEVTPDGRRFVYTRPVVLPTQVRRRLLGLREAYARLGAADRAAACQAMGLGADRDAVALFNRRDGPCAVLAAYLRGLFQYQRAPGGAVEASGVAPRELYRQLHREDENLTRGRPPVFFAVWAQSLAEVEAMCRADPHLAALCA